MSAPPRIELSEDRPLPRRPLIQRPMEGPPPGGFPPVRIRKNLRPKGWSSNTTLLAVGAVILYGHYRYYKVRTHLRNLDEEQQRINLAMAPFLQAESDIKFVVQQRAVKKKIDKLFQDDPDYDPKSATRFFYHSKNFVYPRLQIHLHDFDGLDL